MNSSTANQNFYISGGTLPASALSYVKRSSDDVAFQALMEGEFCYILTSRQMGKSSTTTHVAKRLREAGVAVALFDLTGIGYNLEPEQWYNGLLENLGKRLDLEDEIEDFCLENEHLSPMQRWQKTLRDVVLARIPSHIVIFLDEIDVVRSLPFSTDEFFAAIRACYNARAEDPEYKRLTFCLLGVATPTDLIQNPKLTPFNIGRRIDLRDFTVEEASSLQFGLGRDEGTNRLLMERITYWTGGHPYLTQRLCMEVAIRTAVMTPSGVDETCHDLFLSSQAEQRDDNLIFVQKWLLPATPPSAPASTPAQPTAPVSKPAPSTAPVSTRAHSSGPHPADAGAGDLIGVLGLYEQVIRGDRVKDNEAIPFVGMLKLSGAVRVENGLLRVRNRIYAHVFDRQWVARHMPDAELRRVKAAYRQGVMRTTVFFTVVLALVVSLAMFAVTTRNAAQLRKALSDAAYQREQAQRLFYIADMNLIPAAYEAHQHSRIRELLDETRNSRYCGFEWGYWNRLCREIVTLKGHTESIRSVAFSPDGRRIVTGSSDGTAKVWDAQTGRERLTLNGHWGLILSVAFSPDGRRILTGSSDGTAKLWDTETGRETVTLRGHAGDVQSLAFSPDGRRVVTGSSDGTAKVWDAQTGRESLTLWAHFDSGRDTIEETHGEVYSVAFSPDGRRILAGGSDATPEVFDAQTGRETLSLEGQSREVRSVAFSPDGRRIVTGSSDGTAKVWDAQTGRERLTLNGHSGWMRSVAFSLDGRRIVTGNADGTVRVWNAETGRETLTLKGQSGEVYSVAFSPDGRRIVTGGSDETARVFDAQTGRERLTLTLNGHTHLVWSVAFSPDGRRIVTGGSDGTAKVWDAETGCERLTLRGHADDVQSVAFSADGRSIVTGNADGTVRVWNADSGRETLTLKGHTGRSLSVAFSPDGRRILTGGSDATAIVFDAQTGREMLGLGTNGLDAKGHTGWLHSVAFSPDGRRIVTGNADGTVRVCDADTGREMLTLKGQSGEVYSVAFSPDGRRIVTGGGGETARVFDAQTGRERLTLRGHTESIHSVAFSPDGRRIVTGSEDKTVRVWDAETGREMLTLKGPSESIQSVAFSPDGRRIVTGSADGTARVWFSDPSDWKAAMSDTIEANTHLSLAETLVRAKKYHEVVTEYRSALRLQPDLGSAVLLGNLGWYEYLAGRTDDSIKTSRSALEKDSTLTSVRLNIGLFYSTLDDWPTAKREYDLALKRGFKDEITVGIADVQDAIKKRPNPALKNALAYLTCALSKKIQ